MRIQIMPRTLPKVLARRARLSRLICAAVATVSVGACHHAPNVASVSASHTTARPNMLVSTEWLAKHAKDENLVVLHVGRRAQYDSGHIAGARPVALGELSAPATLTKLSLQIPPIEQLTTWARNNGLGDKSRIVVVPHDDTLQSAARVFLTLAYLGLMDRTSMLDGGYRAWRAEGRMISRESPSAAVARPFTPHVQQALIATIDQVELATHDGKVSLVDARLPRFFNGDGGGYPRPGHIPTATNVPFATVSENGRFKAPTELHKLFLDAGVSESKPIVTYCHIGQQASLLWFVATLLGYDATMFDGSFQEWSGTERLPVVAPPGKK
jgi:thiosulfate/3-mercaptopyruvate sulfurtransferase